MASSKVSGSCLCEGVQYEYTGKPKNMINCHCSMCRRAIGAAYGTFVRVPLSNFKFLKKATLKSYASSENVLRHFCGNCGANIMDTITIDKDHVSVTGGTILGNPGIALQGHIFVGSKAPWLTLNDGLPASNEWELFHQLTNPKKD